MSATTTPLRTEFSAQNSPAVSPVRRVLGDVTPRAINTPSKQTQHTDLMESMRATSPLKQMQTLSPHVAKDKENALVADAFKTGRKRSINEVDGVEHVAPATRLFSGRGMDILRPGVSAMVETLNTLGAPDDRDESGSTTEEDSPPPEQMEDVTNPSQTSNLSFSNFVDWKECAASQSSDRPSQDQPPPAPAPAQKPTRADLLRLRLGFATYKVKTNQIEKPVSEILSSWETTISSSTAATSDQSIPSITLSSARQEPILHVKANLDPGRPIPKLSGGPVLLPTAYSSRMIHDYQMPSSPPDDDLPKCVSPEQVMSPMRADYKTPAARRVREEDYEEDDEAEDDEEMEELTIHERLQRQREKRFGNGDLTSSVVKGNAAKGLLELMSGRR